MSSLKSLKLLACQWLCLILILLVHFNSWARGGGGCFEEGTPIAGLQGDVSIEQLHPGDWVWSNIEGKHRKTQVVSTYRVSPEYYLQFTFPTGSLRVTDEHLIATHYGEFRRAASLEIGEKVLAWHDNQWQRLPIVSITKLKADKPAYNLLVEAGSTYMVKSILVHNKGCFLPDTPVLKSDGSSTAINQIKPGDQVKAYETDGKLVTTQVHAVLKHEVNSYYVVTTEKIVLNVTGEHPFFVGKGIFKTVEKLHSGDLIYAFDGTKLAEQRIISIAKINATTMVYNLQTDEPHTYFAAGIAVHNKGGGGGCFPAGTKVTTPDGSKPIELLSPGDAIISINRNGQRFINHVKSTYAIRSKIISIDTDHGTLHTTAEHPIARKNGDFVNAGQLAVHDVILFKGQNKLLPAVIKSIQPGSETTVFNLQVKSPHTFVADGFLVHNKGGGGGYRGGSSAGVSLNTFFLFLFLYFVWIYICSLFTKSENLDFNFSRRTIESKSLKTVKILEFIAQQDKMMDPVELIKKTRLVFTKLQECWESRDYAPMHDLLMPDLYAQHLSQIAGMIRNHEINRISNLLISHIDLVNVRYTEKRQQREFTALVTASARDFYIDDRSRNYIRGDTVIETFQEFWTFQLQENNWLLRDIEQANESDYLKEENFVEMFTDGQIEKIYQDAVDNLGAAGPGLSKKIESKANKVERMLNFLVQSDKLWDRQAMLNRVRVVFADIHLAFEKGELTTEVIAQTFPDIAVEFVETMDAWKANNNRIEYRNFCVRKVEILLVKNFDDKSKNEFTARVSAHAQRIHYQDEYILEKDEDVRSFIEFWTFGLLDKEWKLKEVIPKSDASKVLNVENMDEGSSLDLVKWYYTKKRAI